MREILFRGKRVDTIGNGEWIEGYYAAEPYVENTYNHGYILENEKDLYAKKAYFVDSRTVGQYTGLTDKNGKKIFEGDILKAVHYFHGSRDEFEKKKIRKAYGKSIENKDSYLEEFTYFRNYAVEYSAKKCAWIGRNGSDQHELISLTNYFHKGAVIGNIYDNPEILKGE